MKIRGVGRSIANLAQVLYWDYKIEPKDAIHVATALMAHVPRLDTKDGGLLAKDGLIAGGLGPLEIKEPFMPQQVLPISP